MVVDNNFGKYICVTCWIGASLRTSSSEEYRELVVERTECALREYRALVSGSWSWCSGELELCPPGEKGGEMSNIAG